MKNIKCKLNTIYKLFDIRGLFLKKSEEVVKLNLNEEEVRVDILINKTLKMIS